MPLKKTGYLLIAMIMLQACSAGRQSGTVDQSNLAPLKASCASDTQINKIHETRDPSIRWFHPGNPEKITGVALVIHGLNFRPSKMDSVIALLTASDIAVLNLSLRGHGENYAHTPHVMAEKSRMEAFKTVSYQQWVDEVCRAYHLARKKSDDRNVPLFLIAHSLGALLGGELLTTYPDVYFDRMVLFAPAFNCTLCRGLKIIAPFPGLVIPSASPASYRSNKGTPMAAYNALFEAITHFKQQADQKLNVPTIIFIDKEDELVSYRKLKRLVKEKKLGRWKFHFLKKGRIGVLERVHHLILDERSLGKEVWGEVGQQMTRHLKP
jgi:pimeloyl-ACP methyl ester carboxylesterase